MKLFHSAPTLWLLLLSPSLTLAAPLRPVTAEEQVGKAQAAFRGTVLRQECFRNPADGLICTRALLRVDEVFKGRLPPVVQVVHPGGVVDGIGVSVAESPQFKTGEEFLLLVSRRPDRTLFAIQGTASSIRLRRENAGTFAAAHRELLDRLRAHAGPNGLPGADVTDQGVTFDNVGQHVEPDGDTGGASTNGLLIDATFGNPARYLRPDRGAPVPYLVDTNHLPAGITPSQSLTAVSNAFNAWAAVSSFRFAFIGTEVLTTNAAAINDNDGTIHLQLHDTFGFIPEANVLGKGGSYFTIGLLPNANWGPGGSVDGTEFNRSLSGFVVLKHTDNRMTNLLTFSEVLTHEIGHVLGLAHSSDDPSETNAVLQQATMYFQVHADGRGASLGVYDPPVVRQVYPFNTPPFSFSRMMDITTVFPPVDVPGMNEIDLRGYDLQSTSLSLAITNPSSLNGVFTNPDGNAIQYVPNAPYSDTSRYDPAGTSAYDNIYARHSDGTNASPFVVVRVLSYSHDTFFTTSDGIPENWMIYYFGNADPTSGSNHLATDDFDGDTINNLDEYRSGMNPTNNNSAQRVTMLNSSTIQWQARAFDLYEIQGSSDLITWPFILPVVPTNATIDLRTDLFATNIIAVASNLPTNSPKMFYRVQRVP